MILVKIYSAQYTSTVCSIARSSAREWTKPITTSCGTRRYHIHYYTGTGLMRLRFTQTIQQRLGGEGTSADELIIDKNASYFSF